MVMVSYKHEFIFLKTRKTAGTSVEMALEPLCRPPGAVITEATPARITREGIVGRRLLPPKRFMRLLRRTNWHNHMAASEVRAALGPDRWARYQKITSIRNPFDLAVSMFHWREREREPGDEDFSVTRARFADWLSKELLDCDKNLLHLDGVFVADQVVRFETLIADVNRVYHRFDPGAGPIEIPHTKNIGSKRKHAVPEYFTEAGIATVQKHSDWVFDRFGYADRPQDRVSMRLARTA